MGKNSISNEKLLDTKHFQFENQKINLRVSIGYAIFGEDGMDIDTLAEKADQMIYERKRKQKSMINMR